MARADTRAPMKRNGACGYARSYERDTTMKGRLILGLAACILAGLAYSAEFEQVRTFTAGEAITSRGLCVKLSAGKVVKAGAGEQPIGVTKDIAAGDGSLIGVRLLRPTVRMISGGVIAIGDVLYPAASGRVAAVQSGMRLGIALNATTGAAEDVEVALTQSPNLDDSADAISEVTPGAGGTGDGVLLKDYSAFAGSSGHAGTVRSYPTTASKGYLSLAATDSTGDTATVITNAAQAGGRTYTIPDAGASASFVMTAGNQTITGTKAFTGTLSVGADASAGVLYVYPATTANGKISIAAADTGGAYTLTITNATLAASRTVTIPDPGGAASFLMSAGNQTITGVKSFTGTLAAGADASAGVLYVYPATTGNGKISIAAADTGGAYTLTITNATLAASRTVTIPDPGAAASFVMTEGTQTINGAKTFGSTIVGSINGNAATATAASSIAGAAVFLSAELTGDGNPQNTAHGLSTVPAVVIAIPSNLTGGAFVVAYGTHTTTNAVCTVTAGEKYRVLCIK